MSRFFSGACDPSDWRCALGFVSALFLFPACARFQPAPLEPVQNAASLDQRRLDTPELRGFLESHLNRSLNPWPAVTWDFNMLFLAGLFYHPALDVARAQWQVALGGNKTAAGRLNPSINAIPGYDLSASGGAVPWIPAVTVDVPIETAGKRRHRMVQARYLSDAARWNLVTAAWQVRNGLQVALIDLTAANARVRLLEQQLNDQAEIVRLLDERLHAGAISSSELTLVRISMDQLRLDLSNAQELAVDSRVRVADAIGLPAGALDGVQLAFDLATATEAAPALLATDLRRRALASRADVLGALAEYEARQAALQLEVAKQYPDIHLGPGYQYDQGDHKITLSLTAELPVLNQNQGPIAEAQARRSEAAAHFTALQAKVLTEIDRAAGSLRVAQTNITALNDLAASQRQRHEQIAAQVQAGAGDRLDLLNSEIELRTSELLQLSGRVKLQQAVAAMEDAIQSPLNLPAVDVIEQSPRPNSLP